MKMAENAEAQLAQKDVQLAMLEAKLCQVQLQFEKSNWSGDMVSSDDQDEKVYLSSLLDIHFCDLLFVHSTECFSVYYASYSQFDEYHILTSIAISSVQSLPAVL